jgi:hypothetical protein
MARQWLRAGRRAAAVLLGLTLAVPAWGQDADAQPRGAQPGPGPDPIPEFRLDTLPTIPTRREAPGPNWVVADAAVLPKDRDGIWVLEFSYKPVRLIEVELPGKGRRLVHYLYYKVVNRTGAPRKFVPQFTLVTDDGKRHEDIVLPVAVRKIQAKVDPSKPLLGAVTVMGEIPPSTKDGIDDAVYGVAIWDDVDFRSDSFKIYVRGLSDGFQQVTPPDGGEPFTRFKALRLDFNRPGDERNPQSREIRLGEPPWEWVYYPELPAGGGVAARR